MVRERKYYIELSEQEYESLMNKLQFQNDPFDQKYLESILIRLKKALPKSPLLGILRIDDNITREQIEEFRKDFNECLNNPLRIPLLTNGKYTREV